MGVRGSAVAHLSLLVLGLCTQNEAASEDWSVMKRFISRFIMCGPDLGDSCPYDMRESRQSHIDKQMRIPGEDLLKITGRDFAGNPPHQNLGRGHTPQEQ